MSRTYKAKYPNLLPATPCSPEMDEQIRHIAAEQGISVADVQRAAFSLFLRRNYRQTIVDNSQIETKCEPA